MIHKAFKEEVHNNWKEAFEPVHESQALMDANKISSHTLFNVKTEDYGKLRPKSRIVAHGNLDAEKEEVRADYAAADMILVRLILFLGSCLGFTFGCTDIKAAFMKYGPITRQVYVRFPRNCPHGTG